MSKKQKNRIGVVYSTSEDFEYKEDIEVEPETLEPEKQMLYVSIDRKQRKGKVVTIISNFIGGNDDLEILAKELKKRCGTGGSVKDGEILIQGEKRDLIMNYLNEAGYRTKLKGG
jgi:translation initiation factor 1